MFDYDVFWILKSRFLLELLTLIGCPCFINSFLTLGVAKLAWPGGPSGFKARLGIIFLGLMEFWAGLLKMAKSPRGMGKPGPAWVFYIKNILQGWLGLENSDLKIFWAGLAPKMSKSWWGRPGRHFAPFWQC